MIIDCQDIVREINAKIAPKKFASGKPITIGGRELMGYAREDGTTFKRWVPPDEAPDPDHHYVEFA